jgi:GTP-binding protein YchF
MVTLTYSLSLGLAREMNAGAPVVSRSEGLCYHGPVGLKCGIVGLPNVGKSTLFNALTHAGVPAENYPFCTTEPNIGALATADPRLSQLAILLKPERIVPALIEFVDIAGLVRGASHGEGMGNEFLDHIRSVDAIAHVVRCFSDPAVSFHESVAGLEPARDAEVVEFELIQKDLQWIEKRRDKAAKLLRTGDKGVKKEVELYERMIAWLNQERFLSSFEWDETDESLLKDLSPLTAKAMFYVANLGEETLRGEEMAPLNALRAYAVARGRELVCFYAKLEQELGELPEGEREDFRRELGLAKSGVTELAEAAYRALGLVTFYTKVGPELRAWPVPAGTLAPAAAGMIHSDMERGFIKAEVASFADFLAAGSEPEARKKGILRHEGRDYRVQDGDIIHFRFNV